MQELPRFPTAERDLAFILDASTTWASLVKVASDATSHGQEESILKGLELFDEFTGKQIGEGKKSLAFRLYLRHDDRTLTAEEINAHMQAIIDAVTEKLGGTLRG